MTSSNFRFKIRANRVNAIDVDQFNTVSIFTPGTDNESKYNEEGEICLTGPTVMLKYLDNEEETKKVLKQHQDGRIWLHTGDIGYMDEDGEIYIKDRIKNLQKNLRRNSVLAEAA